MPEEGGESEEEWRGVARCGECSEGGECAEVWRGVPRCAEVWRGCRGVARCAEVWRGWRGGVADLVLAEDIRGQQVDAVAQREADEAELGREERDLPRGSGGVVEDLLCARRGPRQRRHSVAGTQEAAEGRGAGRDGGAPCRHCSGATVGSRLSLSGGLPARVRVRVRVGGLVLRGWYGVRLRLAQGRLESAQWAQGQAGRVRCALRVCGLLAAAPARRRAAGRRRRRCRRAPRRPSGRKSAR